MDGLQDWLLNFILIYGYAAVFVLLVLGIVGLPIPDELLMMFTGYLASRGQMTLLTVMIVSVSGSLVGMLLSYWLGRRFGLPLLHKLGPRLRLTPARFERTSQWFERFGPAIVTFGYFFPAIRHLSAYFAGMRSWNPLKFFGYAFPGALLWAFIYVRLGYYFGENWNTCFAYIRTYIWIPIGIIVLICLIALWRSYRKQRQDL